MQAALNAAAMRRAKAASMPVVAADTKRKKDKVPKDLGIGVGIMLVKRLIFLYMCFGIFFLLISRRYDVYF